MRSTFLVSVYRCISLINVYIYIHMCFHKHTNEYVLKFRWKAYLEKRSRKWLHIYHYTTIYIQFLAFKWFYFLIENLQRSLSQIESNLISFKILLHYKLFWNATAVDFNYCYLLTIFTFLIVRSFRLFSHIVSFHWIIIDFFF